MVEEIKNYITEQEQSTGLDRKEILDSMVEDQNQDLGLSPIRNHSKKLINSTRFSRAVKNESEIGRQDEEMDEIDQVEEEKWNIGKMMKISGISAELFGWKEDEEAWLI